MKILLTGATGFIGQSLCHALLQQGHNLVIWTRNRKKHKAFLSTQHMVIESLTELNHGACFDVVVNLAGENIAQKRWTKKRKYKLVNSRLDVTNTLIEAIRLKQIRVAHLINASAIGYYGTGNQVHDEQSVQRPSDFPSRLCCLWEQAALKVEKLGVRLTRVRIGLVLGKGGMLAQLLPLFRLGMGIKMGHGKQCMSWIHLHDLIRIFSWIIECKIDGVINATTPNPERHAHFVDLLASVLNRPRWLVLPKPLLRVMFGELSMLLTEGQSVQPARLLEHGFQFMYPQLKPALEQIIYQKNACLNQKVAQ